MTKSILLEAEELFAERAKTHGDAGDNFTKAANIVNAWYGEGVEIDAVFVTRVLQALKMAREMGNPRERDHYTDACGYTRLRQELECK